MSMICHCRSIVQMKTSSSRCVMFLTMQISGEHWRYSQWPVGPQDSFVDSHIEIVPSSLITVLVWSFTDLRNRQLPHPASQSLVLVMVMIMTIRMIMMMMMISTISQCKDEEVGALTRNLWKQGDPSGRNKLANASAKRHNNKFIENTIRLYRHNLTFTNWKFSYSIFTVFNSINRPGHLLNFWTLRVGAYLRWGTY